MLLYHPYMYCYAKIPVHVTHVCMLLYPPYVCCIRIQYIVSLKVQHQHTIVLTFCKPGTQAEFGKGITNNHNQTPDTQANNTDTIIRTPQTLAHHTPMHQCSSVPPLNCYEKVGSCVTLICVVIPY